MKNIVINFIKMIFGLIVNIFVSIIEKIGNIFSNIGYVINPFKERDKLELIDGWYVKRKDK